MKSRFDDNLAVIRSRDQALYDILSGPDDDGSVEVAEGKGGPVPEFIIDGKRISVHSRFDPVKEAERFASGIDAASFDLFVVAGFGFAYHLEELLRAAPRDATVLALEKSPQVVRHACRERDLTALFGDERFRLLIAPSEEDVAVALKGRATRRATFLTHRGSHQTDPAYYGNIIRVAKSYLSTKDVNIATLAKFEKTWIVNIARNIGHIISLPAARSFYGKFCGFPAIVVAAGPSLSQSMEFIRKNSSRAVIVAVDTSYRLLRKNGIEPHFCVTVDPQSINARYFEGDTPGKSVLVADPSSHPSVFRLFRGSAAMCGTAFPMMKWIEDITGERGELTHGGSVSTSAFDFAARLGASPVILVGQDLSFTNGYAHARGSYLDELIHHRAYRFDNPEMFNRRQLTALPKIFVGGIGGGRVHTNQKMMIFLSWFERRNDDRLINATGEGAYINGVRHIPMAELVLGEPGKDIDGIIEALMTAGKEGVSDVPALLDARCAEMAALLESLLPALDRAVGLAGDLAGMMESGARDGGRTSYIIKKLDETDRTISSRAGVKDMIGMSIQRVIHTITEGHDVGDDDGGATEEARIARRSLYLYRGLLEGAKFNLSVLSKMRQIIAG